MRAFVYLPDPEGKPATPFQFFTMLVGAEPTQSHARSTPPPTTSEAPRPIAPHRPYIFGEGIQGTLKGASLRASTGLDIDEL